jgi:uncharacterized protein (AIM24 family)
MKQILLNQAAGKGEQSVIYYQDLKQIITIMELVTMGQIHVKKENTFTQNDASSLCMFQCW